jgi:hypothetical protein
VVGERRGMKSSLKRRKGGRKGVNNPFKENAL